MLTNIGSVAQPEGLSQKQGKKHLPQCCQCEQEIGHVLLLLVHQQKRMLQMWCSLKCCTRDKKNIPLKFASLSKKLCGGHVWLPPVSLVKLL